MGKESVYMNLPLKLMLHQKILDWGKLRLFRRHRLSSHQGCISHIGRHWPGERQATTGHIGAVRHR